MVLLRRGEVRRAVVFGFCFGFCFPLDEVEEKDERETLEDVEASGGRGRVFGGSVFVGDERVRSRVSITSDDRRSCCGVGIGASSKMLVVSRSFVGV